MKIIILINFGIIFFVALVFSVLNFHPVQINLYFTTFSLPLALIMTLELLLGITIGVLIMYIQMLKLKVQFSKNSKKESKVQNKELV